MRQHGDGAYGRQGRRGAREVSGVDIEVREEVVGCGDGEGGRGRREGGGAVLGGGVPLVAGVTGKWKGGTDRICKSM